MLKGGLLLVAFSILSPFAFTQTGPGGSDGGNLTAHQLKLCARAAAATQSYMDSIGRNSAQYGVDPALIMAVITVESDGNPNSISNAGAMGLMQLMPATCIDYQVDQPFDPDSNIRGGTAMLANHFRRYHGDVEKVLAAYNAGIRHADDGSWVNLSETRRYVPTVIAYFEALKGSTDLSAFSDTNKIPILPPEQNIDATPVIPPVDLMFQALRWAPNVPDPAGLAQDSRLEDAAASLLTEYQAGRLTDANLQKRAARAVAMTHEHPKKLRAFCFSTPNLESFPTAWNAEPKIDGNLLGLAHGQSRAGHVWIIIVASL